MRHCALAGKNYLSQFLTPVLTHYDQEFVSDMLDDLRWQHCSSRFIFAPLLRVVFCLAQMIAGLKYLCDADRKLTDGPCSRASILQVVDLFRVRIVVHALFHLLYS
jgi:hypothetical protein